MTPSETLLRKLSNWHPSGAGKHALAAADDKAGWTVQVAADRCDSMGCLVWELHLLRKAPATAASSLQAWAEGAARASTLLDAFKVVEVDPLRNEALLRSQHPSQRDEHVLYYEILLRGTSALVVRRFQASHAAGTHREQVSFALTHEALARLVEALIAAP